MREVTQNLIVGAAKAVYPKCKVVIKMANWCDQYAGMGNDTEKVPLNADGIFSGTESRLWVGREQHLQPYRSYDIMRLVDKLKPGVNKVSWVDHGGADPLIATRRDFSTRSFPSGRRCAAMTIRGCSEASGPMPRPPAAAMNSSRTSSTSLFELLLC